MKTKLAKARSAVTIEYTNCISAEWQDTPLPNKCPRYDTKSSDGKFPILENMENTFIAITPRSTSTQSGSTC